MIDFNGTSAGMSPGGIKAGGLENSGIYTDFSGLASLRNKASEGTDEANREVAQQFESVFIQMMLKTMRDASEIGESSDSDQTRFYQDMFDKQIALDLARGDGIGLAAVIQRELGGEVKSSQVTSRTFSNEVERQWKPVDQKAFVEDLWPYAKKISEELDIEPEAMIAQAALETGWGRRISRDQNGDSSLNLFGIKADSQWQGERIKVSTLEYRDGVASQEQASFRAYNSRQESMADYARFLQDNPRYQKALASGANAEQFVEQLQEAGYATDPAYSIKISAIMQREEFSSTVAELRLSDALVK